MGESGCGKTTLARAVLGLQPVVQGTIDLLGQPIEQQRSRIAERVGMIWQDPFASLDPRWPVGKSVREPAAICKQTVDVPGLLLEAGLDPSHEGRYPHELSGGQRQRVAIARALALKPPLVICDEPTAALDLSIRAQILNLLKSIQAKSKCAFLYISHDLSTVRFLADRVCVMYLGRFVETGPIQRVFEQPMHPYTKALLDSAPTLEKLRRLPQPLPGELPDPRERFAGCRFAARCGNVLDVCRNSDPSPREEGGVTYFCHNPVAAAESNASAGVS
ncbi:MAG: ABC transporter ATP-binding protein [Fimbriimonadaceae bacterium]|nr:ABC transporter ATP-binding protein [Fimbriimonadaceae bacterium]